ncbi:MAG: DNA polymerase Y family protein [Parvibaculum sp.]|uniref:DNA polymerase Y family protein n=1 Tax=Parvibaculum sp. TaxID=2024848 RepID=UPI0034A08302
MCVEEKRRIAALWLPHWPVERLHRTHKRTGGEVSVPEMPLALAVPGQGGVRVTARNRAAAAAGIVPGQLVPDAMTLCPTLDLRTADFAADRAMLTQLALWCGRYTPWTAVDPVGIGEEPDGLLLDISGCDHLFGGEMALVADLRRQLRGLGLTVRVAVASTPGAAWALTRFGEAPAFILPPGEEATALERLPVAALRLADATVDGLMRLGLKRVGNLYDKPRAPIAARFGSEVALRLDEALGFAREPISPLRPPAPFRARGIFAEGLTRTEDIEEAVRLLAGELCRLLARERQGARQLELTLFRADGEVTRLFAGTAAASHDALHLARLFREKLAQAGDDFDAGFGIEAAMLAATTTDSLAPAQDSFGAEGASTEALMQIIDRLGARLGHDRVVRLEPRASHIPERAVASVPALKGAAPAMRGWKAQVEEQMAAALTGRLARPLRLLARPEPVEAVAEVPEGPPRIFRWRRVTHRVTRAEGPERIAPEWWRPGSRRTRDYYRVEDAEGRRFWLYRDGLYLRDTEGPRWYLHGVFE